MMWFTILADKSGNDMRICLLEGYLYSPLSRYTVLLLKCRVLLRHVDSTRITTVYYRFVPVIMTVVLPVMLAGQPLILSLEMERLKVLSIYGRTKNLLRRLFDGIDWRMQDVPGNCGIDYVANGIEFMCRIYCVQMIGRLKNLHHWLDLWWDCYFDNNINKLTIHETEIHYGDKVSLSKVILYFEVQNQNYLTHPRLLKMKLRKCPESGQGNLAPSFEVSNPWFVTHLRFSS